MDATTIGLTVLGIVVLCAVGYMAGMAASCGLLFLLAFFCWVYGLYALARYGQWGAPSVLDGFLWFLDVSPSLPVDEPFDWIHTGWVGIDIALNWWLHTDLGLTAAIMNIAAIWLIVMCPEQD
jgi:hypothetical protein